MSDLERLLADFKSAKIAQQKADDALDAYVRPIVLQYLEAGNYDEARRLASKCGDSLTHVFLLDTIRQYIIANVGR